MHELRSLIPSSVIMNSYGYSLKGLSSCHLRQAGQSLLAPARQHRFEKFQVLSNFLSLFINLFVEISKMTSVFV